MRAPASTRRMALQASAAAAATALLPGTGLAQQVSLDLGKISGRQAGSVHGQRIGEAAMRLKKNPPASRIGLNLLIDALVELELLDKEEAGVLRRLTGLLFEVREAQALSVEIQKVLSGLGSQASQLLVTLVSLLKDSVESARKFMEGLPWAVIVRAIAEDASGALTGAETGMKLWGRPGAIAGAVVGGTSASINSVLSGNK